MTKKQTYPKVDLLRGMPVLSRCSEDELIGIARVADEIVIPAGRVLMTEGEKGEEAFIIVEGTAVVSVGGERLAELGPGDFVGEMALLDRRPRTATVLATSPLRVLAIGTRQFPGLIDLPGVAWAVSTTLAERLRRADAAHGELALAQ